MATTTNIQMPLLEVGQLAPETTVNTALAYADASLWGYLSKSVAGSANVTLTETEARNMVIELTGVLTGSIQVKLPQRENNHIIYNNTSGAFSVTIVPVTSGTGVAVTQGGGSLVYYNGTNIAGFPLSASVGAPSSVQYLTLAIDATLSAERVLTAGANLLFTDAGAGAALTVDALTQNIAFAGDISPTQLAADTNDYAPTGLATASTLRLSTDASRTLTGLTGGADGRILILHNVGSFTLVLADEHASSSAANRFALTANVTMAVDDSCMLRYDSTTARWRLISTTVIAGGSAPTTAQYLTLATDATLTVERVLTAGANLLFTDAGAGAALTVDALTQNIAFAGDISPTQLAANTDDYAPTGLATASTLRLSTDASRNLTGLTGGADGRILIVHNVGSFALVLVDESASSAAANRFALTANATLAADDSCLLRYDSTTARWRLIASSAGGAALSGGAADKVAVWTSSSALTSDTQLHYNTTTDTLGIIATAGGTNGVGLLALGLGTLPTTGPADTVQLLAMDEAAGITGLGVWGEGTTVKHLLGRSLITGTHTRSATMTQGHLIDQGSNNDAILQLQASGTVAHGMTALVATSIYGDFRQAAAGGGGLDIRGFGEAALGLSLYSYTVTNPDTSKTVTSTAATQFSFAKKSGASVSAMDASVNLVCFSDVFLEGNRWILDMDGDTWQPGTLTATSAILSGTITAKYSVEANTAGSGAPNVLAATETMKVLTNEGAAAKNYHTLPTAVAGYVFTFVSQDADLMRVTAAAGDTIRVSGGVTAAAGFIENGAQGDVITLVAINATEWINIGSIGTWTPT